MTSLVATTPSEYTTNTDELDALALNVASDLSVGESVASAVCELRMAYGLRTDVTDTGLTGTANVASNVITQAFNARALAPGHYEWVWNATLSTGAIRSYRTVLKVENHD